MRLHCTKFVGKTTLHLFFMAFRKEESMVVCTWPPLVTENILVVPPHCFTYHRNQRAETSCGSEVTLTFTKRVAKSLAALHAKQNRNKSSRKCYFAAVLYYVSVIILDQGYCHKVYPSFLFDSLLSL